MFVTARTALRPARAATWVQHITHLRALWRSRRALASLTDAQRADVGLSKTQAEAEAERPFWDAPEDIWDAPSHWRC
jgi:uncharacterized protein YjiS (DUF1127 family)